MNKQTNKQLTFIMIAIGLFCGSLGLMLIHFGKSPTVSPDLLWD